MQLALRDIVSSRTIDELIVSRAAIAQELTTSTQAAANEFGIGIESAEVRDIMLPGELKRAFSETVKIRKEGEAQLERARSQQASLRALANAARMLQGNPELMNLRILQSLNTGNPATAPTLIFGVNQGLVPMPGNAQEKAAIKPE